MRVQHSPMYPLFNTSFKVPWEAYILNFIRFIWSGFCRVMPNYQQRIEQRYSIYRHAEDADNEFVKLKLNIFENPQLKWNTYPVSQHFLSQQYNCLPHYKEMSTWKTKNSVNNSPSMNGMWLLTPHRRSTSSLPFCQMKQVNLKLN